MCWIILNPYITKRKWWCQCWYCEVTCILSTSNNGASVCTAKWYISSVQGMMVPLLVQWNDRHSQYKQCRCQCLNCEVTDVRSTSNVKCQCLYCGVTGVQGTNNIKCQWLYCQVTGISSTSNDGAAICNVTGSIGIPSLGLTASWTATNYQDTSVASFIKIKYKIT